MKVRIQLAHKEPHQEPPAIFSYSPVRRHGRFSPLAGIGSVALHAGAGLLLGLIGQTAPPPQPIYEVTLVRLNDTKLIFFPPSERLPDIAPAEDHSTKQTPSGPRRAQNISVNSPQPQEGNQFIWQPPPKLNMQNEVRSPNLLAFAPARPVRSFVAPEQPKTTPERNPEFLPEAAPISGDPAIDASPAAALLGGPAKPPARQFVPPPGKADPIPAKPAALESAPDLPSAVDRSQAALAVISLDPARVREIPVPEGSRPARFSSGPGAASNGASHDAAIVVPGVNVSGGGAAGTPVAVGPPRRTPQGLHEPSAAEWAKAGIGKDSRRFARSMMSVALAPGSRVLTAAVEQKFRDRPVYTTSFGVGADGSAEWIIWFALQGSSGSYLSVRPPVPWNRYGEASDTEPSRGRVQVTAVIDRDGRVDAVAVVQSSDESLRASAVRTIQEWEFLPALRNGEPVAVDVLIDIIFGGRR
ncbi:MAG: hypothetical protein C5B51_06445 [Terriglobia bacterium]|nr:MAG: hypothetical protein C5B51_06445 [Terriglobia bacterium]